jgi:hypothetical protein
VPEPVKKPFMELESWMGRYLERSYVDGPRLRDSWNTVRQSRFDVEVMNEHMQTVVEIARELRMRGAVPEEILPYWDVVMTHFRMRP